MLVFLMALKDAYSSRPVRLARQKGDRPENCIFGILIHMWQRTLFQAAIFEGDVFFVWVAPVPKRMGTLSSLSTHSQSLASCAAVIGASRWTTEQLAPENCLGSFPPTPFNVSRSKEGKPETNAETNANTYFVCAPQTLSAEDSATHHYT